MLSTGRLRARDREPTLQLSSFSSFFEQHHRGLLRALRSITRDHFEAEEIMQDSFLKVWGRWEHMSAMQSLRVPCTGRP